MNTTDVYTSPDDAEKHRKLNRKLVRREKRRSILAATLRPVVRLVGHLTPRVIIKRVLLAVVIASAVALALATRVEAAEPHDVGVFRTAHHMVRAKVKSLYPQSAMRPGETLTVSCTRPVRGVIWCEAKFFQAGCSMPCASSAHLFYAHKPVTRKEKKRCARAWRAATDPDLDEETRKKWREVVFEDFFGLVIGYIRQGSTTRKACRVSRPEQ